MFTFAWMVIGYFAFGVLLACCAIYATYKGDGQYKDLIWLFVPVIVTLWPILLVAYAIGQCFDG